MEGLVMIAIILLAAASGRRAPDRSFESAWNERVAQLSRRADSGRRWIEPLVEHGARYTHATDPRAWAVAASRWVGIESGGDPLRRTSLEERGLAQVMRSSLSSLGLTESDWRAMADPATSSATHADIAARAISGSTARAGKLAVQHGGSIDGWGPGGIGAGKVYHGLPLLWRELLEQRLVRPSIAATVEAARETYRPSSRVARYARRYTGRTVDDLMIRFLAPAMVVAYGHGADA